MPASFDGNDGSDGNSANAGGAGNSTSISQGWFFADRVNLPFVTALDEAPNSGHLDSMIGAVPIVNVPRFPERNWSAEWFSWRVLNEFAAAIPLNTIDPHTNQNWPNWVSANGEEHDAAMPEIFEGLQRRFTGFDVPDRAIDPSSPPLSPGGGGRRAIGIQLRLGAHLRQRGVDVAALPVQADPVRAHGLRALQRRGRCLQVFGNTYGVLRDPPRTALLALPNKLGNTSVDIRFGGSGLPH